MRALAPRRPWQAILFSPVGDGRRRRGSDGVRLGLAVLGLLLCWAVAHADSRAEQTVATTLASPPEGLRWLITTLWWATSVGVVAGLVPLGALGRRWTVLRDVAVSAAAAWLLCLLSVALLGHHGDRPPSPALVGFDLSFPAVRTAVVVGAATAMLPSVARWMQRTTEGAILILALTTVVSAHGLPAAVAAGALVGWGVTAAVHPVFGSSLGLPSAAEMVQLLGQLALAVAEVAANPTQRWGVPGTGASLRGRRSTSRSTGVTPPTPSC